MPRGGGYYGRADINFRSFFQDFNMSKFVVYSSLLTFSMLFALKRDGILHWSWWSIFIPLFVWKGFAGIFSTMYNKFASWFIDTYRLRHIMSCQIICDNFLPHYKFANSSVRKLPHHIMKHYYLYKGCELQNRMDKNV